MLRCISATFSPPWCIPNETIQHTEKHNLTWKSKNIHLIMPIKLQWTFQPKMDYLPPPLLVYIIISNGEASYCPKKQYNKLPSSFLFVCGSKQPFATWMWRHAVVITLIIHEKSNEHIQKVLHQTSMLIKVYLFGIWIMKKHCGAMAAINL